jgi:hypothetical protein
MKYEIKYDGSTFTIFLYLKEDKIKLTFSETIRLRDKLNEVLTEIQRKIAYNDLDESD